MPEGIIKGKGCVFMGPSVEQLVRTIKVEPLLLSLYHVYLWKMRAYQKYTKITSNIF